MPSVLFSFEEKERQINEPTSKQTVQRCNVANCKRFKYIKFVAIRQRQLIQVQDRGGGVVLHRVLRQHAYISVTEYKANLKNKKHTQSNQHFYYGLHN
jgi:hypothetical protein